MGELALLFLRLGATAFGGPAAHIALMEDECVKRRGWLTRDEFLDLVGATNLIPGPNSTEMAIHIGRLRGGWRGLVVAGACFILPAALIVGALAWAYVRYQGLPEVDAVFGGIYPVIIAVVAQALGRLARTAVKSVAIGVVGALSVGAVLVGVDEIAVLLAAGACCVVAARVGRGETAAGFVPFVAVKTTALAGGVSLGALFLSFVKIGSVLFGSGYVLLAFLRADFVESRHWLTEGQLLDAIAVGQLTPGPVFTTATFIGYLLDGAAGAAVATAGIFLPAFVFVAISSPLIPRLRKSPTAGAFLDGVNVASLALMGLVAVELGRTALADIPSIAIACIAALALIRFGINSLWLVLGGAIVGVIRYAA